MVHYSILIPQRNASPALARQLVELEGTLARLGLDYEIICIDDGSRLPTVEMLEHLLTAHAGLRVLRFDHPQGLSAALSAGLAAARGEIVIATAPGNEYPPRQMMHLIAALSRGDLVFGRRRRTGLAKAWRRLARIPRWLVLGLQVRDPDCLFWAARREAVEHLALARGMFRYLPTLVASRRFRVSEVAVEDQPAAAEALREWPNPLDLFVVGWLRLRSRMCEIQELGPQTNAPHIELARVRRAASRADFPAVAMSARHSA